MLVAITVICVMFAIFGRVRSRAIVQQKTIEAFNSTKAGMINYDFELKYFENQSAGVMSTGKQSWLADQFGTDWVHSVGLVNFWRSAKPTEIQLAVQFDRLQVIKLEKGLQNQEAWDELTKARRLRKLEICFDPHGSFSNLYHETNRRLNPTYRREKIEPPPIMFVGLSKLTRLKELALNSGRLTLSNLQQIAATKNIQTLRLLEVQITPADLMEFPRMETIKSLYWSIYLNPFDDAEFRFIENLPNLENLVLSGSHELTDQVFSSLEKLSHLKQLSLHGTQLTGTELKRLRHLNLDKLELAASNLNDTGLAGIEDFQQLTHLEIGSTRVTDAGMESVSRLPLLRHLSIRDTAIGDAGLMQLTELKQLKFLRIRDTAITAAGLAEFRKRSSCLVDRN